MYTWTEVQCIWKVFHSASRFPDFVVLAIFQNGLNFKQKYCKILYIKKHTHTHITFTASRHQQNSPFASWFVSCGLRVLQGPFGKHQEGCRVPFGHPAIQVWLLRRRLSFWRFHRGTLTNRPSSSWLPPRLRPFYPDPSWTASSESPAGSERLPLTDDGGHCALWDLQSSGAVSVPFPQICTCLLGARMCTANRRTLRCVPSQIMTN